MTHPGQCRDGWHNLAFTKGERDTQGVRAPEKSQPLSNSCATVSLYLDTYYGYSFNQPRDNTIAGSGAVGRNTEWQINNATIGIDTRYKNVTGKLTLQAGYFYSYIGLESYLLAENWNYNRSFVSDFTPFYFSGARIQIFPTDKIKIEPWFMNGYQTYGK